MEIYNEEWIPIANYEGLYEVSSLGRVKSLRNGIERILKLQTNTFGYLFVILCNRGNRKTITVHSLVAQAFIPNPHHYKEINHINEDKTDNRVENLEWCDRKYNINYGTRNQRVSKQVYQLDKNTNEIINVFPSAKEIERQLGFAQGNISLCCNGKISTAYKYKWRYA